MTVQEMIDHLQDCIKRGEIRPDDSVAFCDEDYPPIGDREINYVDGNIIVLKPH